MTKSTGSREGRRWWHAAPDPVLPPIGARRAYTEVLLVYLAFFAVGVVNAGLLLADRYREISKRASWAIYMPNVVDIVAQIGLAVAVVMLLAARRGVTPSALGLPVARRPDGRPAVSQTVRIVAWAFFAQIVGGIINALLQTGSLPERHTNAPELIFAMFDATQAGIIEELVVLAFVVVTLRQAGRPWWEVTTVALVLRAAYHIYYGPGVVGILVWAALFYWIYLRFRQLTPLIVSHAVWDAVAFSTQSTSVVVGIGFFLVLALWIVAPILWLIDRNDRPAPGPHPPPGWHPDPDGNNRWRWWDGYRWTDYVSPHS